MAFPIGCLKKYFFTLSFVEGRTILLQRSLFDVNRNP